MRAPEFWTSGGSLATLLAPAAAVYDLAGQLRRALTHPVKASVPVVCVGNLTVGGAGKTPVALAITQRLRAHGKQVHILTRGYRGCMTGPVAVDPARHTAREVGDEALLLAAAAPTWVARDRPAGARAAAQAGAQIIVMDDGLQSATLTKDVSLLVIDGGYGFGNGLVIPAGPLREAPPRGFARADAVIVVDDPVARAAAIEPRNGTPWLAAHLVPDPRAEALAGQAVVAFAGIGRPEKFFNTLRAIGCRLVEGRGFPDHHFYDPDEIMRLVELACERRAQLVTTMKDVVRLPAEARAMVTPVTVNVEFEDPEALDRVLDPVLHTA